MGAWCTATASTMGYGRPQSPSRYAPISACEAPPVIGARTQTAGATPHATTRAPGRVASGILGSGSNSRYRAAARRATHHRVTRLPRRAPCTPRPNIEHGLQSIGIDVRQPPGTFHSAKISAQRTRFLMVMNPKYVTASLMRTIGFLSRKKAELVICSTLVAIAGSACTMSPIWPVVTVGCPSAACSFA